MWWILPSLLPRLSPLIVSTVYRWWNMPDYLGDDQRKVNKDTEDEEKIACEFCPSTFCHDNRTHSVHFHTSHSSWWRRHSDIESLCKLAWHGPQSPKVMFLNNTHLVHCFRVLGRTHRRLRTQKMISRPPWSVWTTLLASRSLTRAWPCQHCGISKQTSKPCRLRSHCRSGLGVAWIICIVELCIQLIRRVYGLFGMNVSCANLSWNGNHFCSTIACDRYICMW